MKKIGDVFSSKNNDWIFQAVIDNLALIYETPLRIVDISKLSDLYQVLCNASGKELLAEFPDRNKFDNFCTELVEWVSHGNDLPIKDGNIYYEKLSVLNRIYEKTSFELIPVLPSNMHPMEFLCQTVIELWRIYTILWMYKYFIIENNSCVSHSQHESCYEIDGYHVEHFPLKISNVDYLIIIGPFFPAQSELYSEYIFDQDIVERSFSKINRFAKTIAKDEHIRKSYFRQIIHQQVPIHRNAIDEISQSIAKAIDMFCATVIDNESNLSNKRLRLLVLWITFLIGYSKNIRENSLSLISPSDGMCDQLEKMMVVKSSKNSDKLWELSFVELERSSYECHVVSGDGDPLSHMDDLFRKAFIHLERNTKLLDSTRLSTIKLWLDSQFSGLVPKSLYAPKKCINVGDRIASWICAVLRADIAEVHSYFPEEPINKLRIDSIYIRSQEYQRYRDNIVERLENLDATSRSVSSIYSSLQSGNMKICLNADPSCPHDSNIVSLRDLNDKLPAECAEIVVPVKFNGRVIGGIEVAAFTPWRFRFGQQVTLLNISTAIAGYWYQQRHTDSLQKVQSKVLEFDRASCTEEELYDTACEQAAILFIASGAGLWVRNEVNSTEFRRIGKHNTPDVDSPLTIDSESMLSKIVQEAEGLKLATSFLCEEVRESDVLHPANKKKLMDDNVNYLAQIPILNQKNRVIAVLSIYDKSRRGFDESWRYIADFFAGYLNVVIESVQVFIREKKGIEGIAAHEIWDVVSMISDKAKKLSSPVSTVIERLERYSHAMNNPAIKDRLLSARIMGELPSDVESTDIDRAINKLRTSIVLPRNDIGELATDLRNQLMCFDGEHMEGYKRIHHSKVKKLLGCTQGDKGFIDFLVRRNLLDESEQSFNLRELINSITEGDSVANYREVGGNINLKMLKGGLKHVLTNLWVNAKKYARKRSTIVLFTERLETQAIRLTIRNDCALYDEEVFERLTEKYNRGGKPVDHRGWDLNGKEYGGYNAGLGLYIVKNLCNHILNISFSVRQEKKTGHGGNFVCEIIFNPLIIE